MTAAALESYLHAQIPLTRAMAVSVEKSTLDELILTAPLEPNHNHLGTAFGGSLAALATLAGYSLLWLRLGDAHAHVLVRESAIQYLRPVRGALRAICRAPTEPDWTAFHHRFLTTGKARIPLTVQIVHDHQTCVQFTGQFVAQK